MFKILKNIDFLSPPITLFHLERRTHTSNVGGFLVILMLSISTLYISFLFYDLYNHKSIISIFHKKFEYEAGYYNSFNDFFTRKIIPGARPIDMTPDHLVSPCDSKLTVYPIDEDSIFEIKGVSYHIEQFLRSEKLAEKYKGGHFCVFRLEVGDYHRYMYFDNGFKSKSRHIKGFYHTVNPVALEKTDIYRENTREYTILHTENFGRVIMAEVGAMLVGRIDNHHKGRHRFKRGDEKGMFKYGGSTVVLIFERDVVEFDADILRNSLDGFETVVKMGERIGSGR